MDLSEDYRYFSWTLILIYMRNFRDICQKNA